MWIEVLVVSSSILVDYLVPGMFISYFENADLKLSILNPKS